MNQGSASTPTAPTSRLQVLVLGPDESLAAEILGAVEEAVPGTIAARAASLGEAQQLVVDQKPALFVLDVDATYDLAQEFIYDLRTSHPDARAIILTAIHFAAQREQVAGLGAIHFLEKPFPRADFMTLVEALLAPSDTSEGERFQGTLSDLHIADIIQLKCISGATSMLEFTGPRGEKARVYFENGQVRHATAPGKEGLAAFNEIVDWKGGMISEVPVPLEMPRTIEIDWQVLLMEAVRTIDESRNTAPPAATETAVPNEASSKTILVIDDSAMLLSFIKEILDEQNYRVLTAPTAAEGLEMSRSEKPDLILLDFILPDMKGDAVCRQLVADPLTAKIPVVYVSGFGSDLQPNSAEIPNVIGALNKPFTSETLINSVRSYLGGKENAPNERRPVATTNPRPMPPPRPVASPPSPVLTSSLGKESKPAPPPPVAPAPKPAAPPAPEDEIERASRGAYFCGDSSFFSLHWALQTIAREKLTGRLHAFWSRDSVELLAREGEIVLVTTRNPQLYCEEAPVTLLNVGRERIEAARERQTRDGCPIFITLAGEGLILREPAMQLVQHYGQLLFSQLWTERVRFMFEQQELPEFTGEMPPSEDSLDQWALSTLRFVQYPALNTKELSDSGSVPAYTRDGYERVQELRLTVAEAQFASQFNGSRSIAQISKNLRLDIKFARLTLFRFLALEIVECWPAQIAQKSKSRGGLRGLFSR
ncbi:MAG: response regulator [Verrucomicrobiota bacterium]|nr:response regulator [Verrucomicrobiota bacterium]